MKLTYWKATCKTDSDVYSIRAKTRKECNALLDSECYGRKTDFNTPHKVTIEYDNAFDLLTILRSEDATSY